MRVESKPLAFVYDSRADVIHELLHGSHAHNLVKFECRSCLRIHVRVTSPMLTPFSGGRLRVPDGVIVSVDEDWKRWIMNRGARETPDCPACGVAMVPVRDDTEPP